MIHIHSIRVTPACSKGGDESPPASGSSRIIHPSLDEDSSDSVPDIGSLHTDGRTLVSGAELSDPGRPDPGGAHRGLRAGSRCCARTDPSSSLQQRRRGRGRPGNTVQGRIHGSTDPGIAQSQFLSEEEKLGPPHCCSSASDRLSFFFFSFIFHRNSGGRFRLRWMHPRNLW